MKQSEALKRRDMEVFRGMAFVETSAAAWS